MNVCLCSYWSQQYPRIRNGLKTLFTAPAPVPHKNGFKCTLGDSNSRPPSWESNVLALGLYANSTKIALFYSLWGNLITQLAEKLHKLRIWGELDMIFRNLANACSHASFVLNGTRSRLHAYYCAVQEKASFFAEFCGVGVVVFCYWWPVICYLPYSFFLFCVFVGRQKRSECMHALATDKTFIKFWYYLNSFDCILTGHDR